MIHEDAWTTERIRAAIRAVMRVGLACLPMPLLMAPRLSEALGGARIFVKREELTDVAFGGNKTRNPESCLAAEEATGADFVVMELGSAIQPRSPDRGLLQWLQPHSPPASIPHPADFATSAKCSPKLGRLAVPCTG